MCSVWAIQLQTKPMENDRTYVAYTEYTTCTSHVHHMHITCTPTCSLVPRPSVSFSSSMVSRFHNTKHMGRGHTYMHAISRQDADTVWLAGCTCIHSSLKHFTLTLLLYIATPPVYCPVFAYMCEETEFLISTTLTTDKIIFKCLFRATVIG